MQKPLVALDGLHRFLDERLRRHPTYVDVLNLRALSWAVQGNLDASRDDLAEALRLAPDYREALINLVWLHTVRDEPGAYHAILQSRRAQDMPPAVRLHLELLGLQRWDGLRAAQERWDGLDAETQRHPVVALDGLWLAVRDRNARRLPDALQLLHDHHCEWAWHLQCVSDASHSPHAKQALEAWALLYAGNPGMQRLVQAQLPLLEPEQLQEAEGLLHWATLVSADLCAYWIHLGAHHDRLLHNEEAESAYKKAIAIDGERAAAHLNLGHLYAALGRAEDACQALEQVCRLQPEWADAHYLLGLVCEDLGVLERAEAEYRTSETCNPRYLLPKIARGKLLATQERHAEAVQVLEEVRKSGLDSVDLNQELASSYATLGNEHAARAAQERVRSLTAADE